MKIIKLEAENFKRLTVVAIAPTGNLVEIGGKNGQGKTSVLDAIWVALGGMSASPAKPIRSGEESAVIKLDLGDYRIIRKFKPGKDGGVTTDLRVENAEGTKLSNPQTILDSLLGKLTFDPLQFARMDKRAKFDTMRAFVPSFDFIKAEDDNRKDYDKRTTVNRQAKEARAAAELIKLDPSLPEKAPSIVELSADLDAAGKHNADIETRKSNRERFSNDAANMRKEAQRILNEADSLAKQAEVMRNAAQAKAEEAKQIEEKLAAAGPLPEPIDTTPIRQKIAESDRVAAAIRDRDRRNELVFSAKASEEEAELITERMNLREIAKRDAIASANLPVDGITFGNNEVLLGGVPFEQASDAQQLIASLSIAMAMNPKLKIIRIRDGSLLDDDSLRLVAEIADKNDYQIWIERVGNVGKTGIVLEDGHVKQREMDQ